MSPKRKVPFEVIEIESSVSGGDAARESSSDVEVVRPREASSARDRIAPEGDLEREGISIAGGVVANVPTRDMPHPRPSCSLHAHAQGENTANALHCDNCYCYVCDVKASTCTMWGTGASARDHCNARKSISWDRLRNLFKAGRVQEVKSAHAGGSSAAAASSSARAIVPKKSAPAAPAVFTAPAAAASASAVQHDDEDEDEDDDDDDDEAILPNTFSLMGHVFGSLVQRKKKKSTKLSRKERALALRAATTGPVAPGLLPMPNPSMDNNCMELGKIIFRVRAVKGKTLQSIIAKVSRNGFYTKKGSGAASATTYGDALCLQNVFEQKYPPGTYSKMKAVHLKITVEEPDAKLFPPVPPDRVRSVTVYDMMGRVPGVVMGITTAHHKCKVRDILSRLLPLLDPPYDPRIEEVKLVKCSHDGSRDSSSTTYNYIYGNHSMLMKDEDELSDSFFTSYQIRAYRLPKAIELAEKDQVKGKDLLALSAPSYGKKCDYVMVVLRWDSTRKVPILDERRWALGMGLDPTEMGFPSDDDEGDDEDGGALGRPVVQYREVEDVKASSVPILLPLSEEMRKAGPGPNQAMTASIMRALKPYIGTSRDPVQDEGKEDEKGAAASSAAARGSKVSKKSSKAAPIKNKEAAGKTPKDSAAAATGLPSAPKLYASISHAKPLASSPTYAEPGTNPMSHVFSEQHPHIMSSLWTSEAAALVDFEALSKPSVDPSASPAVTKVTKERMEKEVQRDAEIARLKRLPTEIIAELVEATRRYSPAEVKKTPLLALHSSAYAATTLTIHPIGPGDVVKGVKPKDLTRDGYGVIHVYAFKKPASGVKTLFKDSDDWTQTAENRYEVESFPLRKSLEAIFNSSPRAAEMHASLNAHKAAAHSTTTNVSSVNGLLSYLECGEMEAAPQPPGLSVKLRSYQLQSLKFMMDAEKRDGGFRSLFWVSSNDIGTDKGEGGQNPRSLPAPSAPSSSSSAAAAAAAASAKISSITPTPPSQPYYYSPVFRRLSLKVDPCNAGGFLAEEMGLGKTVEVLALILSNPAPPSVVAGSTYIPPPGMTRAGGGSLVVSRATLVVCAVSLVGQWVDEAMSKSAGSLRILSYHGQKREQDLKKISLGFDLVVTTYETLGSDYGQALKVEGEKGKRKGQGHPLGDIHWHRIVFDEGHMVKSAAAQRAKACALLSSHLRWCCTGTPIGSEVLDLLGQFTVIGMSPFSIKSFFDTNVKQAFGAQSGRYGGTDASTLLFTLKQCMVRHTKNQVLSGEQVLQLPPKTEEDLAVVLTQEEQELYKKVFEQVRIKWQRFAVGGASTVTRYQMTIMSLLGPLRRICSGGTIRSGDIRVPDLEPQAEVVSANLVHGGAGSSSIQAATALLKSNTNYDLISTEGECSICLDVMENPVQTPCRHWFCRECILGWLSNKATCTLCRSALLPTQLAAGVMPGFKRPEEKKEEGGEGEGGEGAALGEEGEPPLAMCESKLRVLIQELRSMRAKDPTAKALVFSQYATTLAWLEKRLPEEGFKFVTITGSMDLKKRTKNIEAFQKAPPTTLFLLSMRSGAVGINLTAASHVFILEPCLNPALEEQAIGRSWRMGQQRSVVVKRFYAQGSVEEAIIKVVKARREAGAAAGAAATAAGGDDAAAAAAAAAAYLEDVQQGGFRRRGGVQRVMADAVAGNIKADRQNLRMGELEKLFAAPDFSAGFAPPWQPFAARVRDEEDEMEGEGAGGGLGRSALVLTGRRRRRASAVPTSKKSRKQGDSDDDEDDEDEEEGERMMVDEGLVGDERGPGDGRRVSQRKRKAVSYVDKGSEGEEEGGELRAGKRARRGAGVDAGGEGEGRASEEMTDLSPPPSDDQDLDSDDDEE